MVGLKCLRIGSGDRILWTRQRSPSFITNKISWPAGLLSASQEWLLYGVSNYAKRIGAIIIQNYPGNTLQAQRHVYMATALGLSKHFTSFQAVLSGPLAATAPKDCHSCRTHLIGQQSSVSTKVGHNFLRACYMPRLSVYRIPDSPIRQISDWSHS